MRLPLRPIRLRAVALGPVLSAILLAGCGEAKVVMSAESSALSGLIDSWNDAKLNAKAAEKLFVKGSLPAKAEFKKYRKYSYALTSTPRVSGTSTTVPISLYDEAGGTNAGKQDWQFEKDGEGWKIKSAPLP